MSCASHELTCDQQKLPLQVVRARASGETTRLWRWECGTGRGWQSSREERLGVRTHDQIYSQNLPWPPEVHSEGFLVDPIARVSPVGLCLYSI